MAATPINILIDGESLLKHFSQASIKFSEGLFCNSIDLSVISDALWTKFDPIVNFGLLRLQTIIGTTNYEFLIEERNTTVSIPGISFTSWGRSAQALLDKPYANPLLTDLEEKIHPWQKGNVRATGIINYAMNYCCSAYTRSKVVIHWDVEDFIVYKDTFSTSNSSPIEIISQLAGIIGAEFIANADGSLTIQEYSVGTLNPVTKLTEDIAIQDYNDMDHIVSLNDDIIYPIGYNSVIVNGYGTEVAGGGDDGSNSPYLSVELLPDDLKGWEFGRTRRAKVRYYHPKNLAVHSSVLGNGGLGMTSGTYSETLMESVLLTWGVGSTTYPNTKGVSDVLGDTNTPLEYRIVTYSCLRHMAYLTSYIQKGDMPEKGIFAFYFSDKTNTQIIEFDYYDPNPPDNPGTDYPSNDPGTLPGTDPGTGSGTSDTSDIQLELNETDADKDQLYLKFKIWGEYVSITRRLYDSVYNHVTASASGSSEYFTEKITFSSGKGSLAHPFNSYGTPIRWITPEYHNVLFKQNSTEVSYDWTQGQHVSGIAEINYGSKYSTGQTNIPQSFVGESFSVYLEKIDYSTLSVSKTVNNTSIIPPGTTTKDVALLVKDFATEVVIPNANVTIDGSSRGLTNSEGIINLIGIAVGDHTIRITASGYLDSDEDELANDTFTVS